MRCKIQFSLLSEKWIILKSCKLTKMPFLHHSETQNCSIGKSDISKKLFKFWEKCKCAGTYKNRLLNQWLKNLIMILMFFQKVNFCLKTYNLFQKLILIQNIVSFSKFVKSCFFEKYFVKNTFFPTKLFFHKAIFFRVTFSTVPFFPLLCNFLLKG